MTGNFWWQTTLWRLNCHYWPSGKKCYSHSLCKTSCICQIKCYHKSTENYSIVDHIHHHALNIAKLNNLVFWARTFFKIRKKCFVQINVFDNLFYRKERSGPILRQKSALSSNLKRPASKSVKIMLGTTNKTSCFIYMNILQMFKGQGFMYILFIKMSG